MSTRCLAVLTDQRQRPVLAEVNASILRTSSPFLTFACLILCCAIVLSSNALLAQDSPTQDQPAQGQPAQDNVETDSNPNTGAQQDQAANEGSDQAADPKKAAETDQAAETEPGMEAGKDETPIKQPVQPARNVELEVPDTANQDASEEADTPPQGGNAFGRFLGRLLLGDDFSGDERGPRKQALRADPRAPMNPKLSGLLKKAQTHFRANEARQCAEVLQKLLEQPEDALWESTPGKLISVRTAAQRLLAKLPQPEQERYRLLMGGQAQRELQAAQATGDSAGLAQVATRYFQTEAGFLAADQLASKYLDRGEFGLAAHWLEELWLAQAPCTRQPGWRLKAEFVAKMVPTTGLARVLKSQSQSLPPQVKIAGEMVDSRTWLASLTGGPDSTTPVLDEWRQFFGSAKRVGQAAAGEPLLLKRWALPLTSNPAVQNMMDKLVEDLRDQRQSPILGFDPLMVDGKVIYRSLRGVQVLDAQSGKPLWTTPEEPSADDLLAAVAAHQSNLTETGELSTDFPGLTPFMGMLGDVFDEMQDMGPSDHPLTSLLFRNANHGLLSSDGRRLFVIEEQSVLSNLQPGKYFGEEVPDTDLFGRPLGINRLTAYDLQSGRSVWEVGGRDLHDPFALPLAGTFLFGPPVVEGGDLFLVNEADGEIRLQVLDPASGMPRWSQLIAHAQAKIGIDFGRQWFTSQVAVADGVIVCPTTVGWLVAVDRTTRNILWAFRYQDQRDSEPSDPQEEVVQSALLNERWTAAPPVIVGNRVLYTPAETPTMVCLNLSDGALLWRRSRDDESLYLAGVFGKQAVVVGSRSIMAIDIENKGRQLWSVKYGAKDARPAGRGIAVENKYFLPLTSGELLCVNLDVNAKSDRIVSRLKLPASSQPELQKFGNLAMYRGMLISLGLSGIVAFEPKLSIETELQAQLVANPLAPAAVVRKAELELLHNQPRAALKLLHELQGITLEDELQKRYRAASITALTALVREDLKANDAEFEELARWADLPADLQAREMLKAERLIARQNFIQAFEVYLSFSQSFSSVMIVPGPATTMQVRGDCWAAGKLLQLWSTLPPETTQILDQRVRELAAAAVTADLPTQQQFVTLFGFHSASQPVRQRMVEALADVGAWQAAENVLWDLKLDPEQAGWAEERLGRLWRQNGFTVDAASAYQNLERDFATARLAEGRTGLEIVQSLRDAGQLPLNDTRALLNWGSRNLELSRSGSNFDIGGGGHVFPLQGTGLPFFQRHRIQYVHQDSRFEVIDVGTEQRVWSIPLRMSEDLSPEAISARVSGHAVVLFGGGQVTALSPMERKVLWTRPRTERGDPDEEGSVSDAESSGSGQRLTEPLRSLVTRGGRHGDFVTRWAIFPRHGAPQVIANQRYVSHFSRRQLVVLDAVTGETLWERHDLPAAAMIRGGSKVIYVLDLFGESVTAYRAIDGTKIEIPRLSNVAKFAFDLVEDDFIRLESPQISLFGGTPSEVKIQRFDPQTQTAIWKTTLSAEAKATSISGQRLVTLNPDGQLQLCDLKTGKLRNCGALPPKTIRSDSEIRIIPSFDQLLAIVNQDDSFPEDNYPESFASLRVHGMVHSFELNSGREQWKQKVDGLHLILERLDYSPVVFFLSRKFQRNLTNNWLLTLKAIDRHAGRIVHESDTFVQSSFHLLTINVPDAFIELRTYNDRLRLAPKSE